MMKLQQLKPINGHLVNVIIETPKGSQHKYAYDEELQLFKLKKTLPVGMSFPFDFGFIPNTRGGDGDPLDVLVIMDEPAYSGCLVACRIIAVLKATQGEPGNDFNRNDRLIGIAEASHLYAAVRQLNDLSTTLSKSIEDFFIDYNAREGKKFTPISWEKEGTAIDLIREAEINVQSD